jgi:hypothetical protein
MKQVLLNFIGHRFDFRSRISLWCVLALFSLSGYALAQTFSASISGIVSDPSGAVLSGAKVTLTNTDTHDTRDYSTSDDGNYKFDNLLPGPYQIDVTMSGFKSYTQSNMLLRANTAAAVNVSLEVGALQEKVEVTGETVLVDTQSANNSVTMDSQLIEALPNNTRSPLNFVFSLAGTTEGQGGMTSRSGTFDQNFSMFGLNGGRTGNAQILIDGLPSTAMDWGGLIVSPINDSVQEQQVATNVYDSQYERSGMGVVTLVTKGGTNAFHGEFYDFFRNSALDANAWANNEFDQPKGQFKRNQFGGNIGGPISKRYNLYFFGAYEGLRQPDTGNSGLLTVPTLAERNGDFSQSLNANGDPLVVYNPFSSTQVTDAEGNTYYTRTPFAGNVIPQNLLNATGVKYANLFPLPNRASQGPNDFNNYLAQAPGNTTNDKFEWRVDWVQNEKHRLFARMSDRVRQNQVAPCYFCNGADNTTSNDDRGFQVVLNDTVTPSPTWVINAYVGYGRWYEAQNPTIRGESNAATVGLDPSQFQGADVLPTLNLDQYSSLGAQPYNYNRYVRYNETAILNFTKQLSKHTIRFGGNYDVLLINNEQYGLGSVASGSFLTACDPGPGSGPCQASANNSTTSGNAIASLLLGTGDVSSTFNPLPAMSQHAFGVYIQDQWRVTPRLTVNLGLRYENQRPATERYNQLAWFDPTVVNPISSQLGYNVYGGFEYADKNHRNAWDPDNTNFAPRVGIAYRATDKVVIRAGAGMFYTPSSAMLSFDFPGQFLGYGSNTTSYGTENALGIVPTTPISSGLLNGNNPQTGSSEGLNTYVGLGAGQFWLKGAHPIGYTEQWSFDIQYQLSSHSVFEIGYTGVNGRKLMYGNPNININQLPSQYLSQGDASLQEQVPNPFAGIITNPNSGLSGDTVYRFQLLQPYPEFGSLNVTRSLPGARSSYNALDVKYNQAFSHGFSGIVTYRWSKALDNGSEDLVGWSIGNLWRDSYNTMADYGVSTHDQPHSFAVAGVYDLPYGTGKQWGSSSPWLVKQVLGNWQLSTSIRIASGFPIFGIFNDYNSPLSNLYGFPSQATPDLVGNPVPSHQTPDQWINPDAFVNTDGLPRLGSTPTRIPSVREAWTKNVDLSIAKNFGPEGFRVQFRGDFLNAFNHPIFGGNYNFNTCLYCGGTFGQVYSTRNDPRNVQLAIKAVF